MKNNKKYSFFGDAAVFILPRGSTYWFIIMPFIG